jgi:hypothetical protein
MNQTHFLIFNVAALLAGCAAPPPPPPPAIDHPANPQAAEAPVPVPFDTLTIDDNPTMPAKTPPDEAGGQQKNGDRPMKNMPGMTSPGDSMKGMPGMNSGDSMQGMAGMNRGKSMLPEASRPGMPGPEQPNPVPTTRSSTPAGGEK